MKHLKTEIHEGDRYLYLLDGMFRPVRVKEITENNNIEIVFLDDDVSTLDPLLEFILNATPVMEHNAWPPEVWKSIVSYNERKAQQHFDVAEKVTNEHGGQQSRVDLRYDDIPPEAMDRIARVLCYGHDIKGYKHNNWRKIPRRDHIRHVICHIYRYLLGDTTEDHLGHALCRLAFACSITVGDKDYRAEDWPETEDLPRESEVL